MSDKMSKEEANKVLSEKLAAVKALMSECENLADEHGLSFSSPIGEYGMGGQFYGKGPANEDGEWEESDSNYGWVSSSNNC
jgi:hypothetical protein